MLHEGMGKRHTATELIPAEVDDGAYDAVLADVSHLLESARRAARPTSEPAFGRVDAVLEG
jgi:hypothetical protein